MKKNEKEKRNRRGEIKKERKKERKKFKKGRKINEKWIEKKFVPGKILNGKEDKILKKTFTVYTFIPEI